MRKNVYKKKDYALVTAVALIVVTLAAVSSVIAVSVKITLAVQYYGNTILSHGCAAAVTVKRRSYTEHIPTQRYRVAVFTYS